MNLKLSNYLQMIVMETLVSILTVNHLNMVQPQATVAIVLIDTTTL